MNVFGPRIHIRPTQREDLLFLQALWNDGQVMRYLGYPDGMHVSDTGMLHWWMMTPQAQSSNPNILYLAPPPCVMTLLDDTLIGELTYSIDAHQRALVHLKLAPEFWGHGYAQEAMIMALRELFATTAATMAISEPSAANIAARRFLEHCGFTNTPTENHPDRWACSRTDFAQATGARLAKAG